MWPAMTVDDYAALELSLGTRLVRVGGVWWRRVRPCFYRPLFPFEPLPVRSPTPLAARLGGWQHVVADDQPHNSHLNFMVFRYPQGYDRAQLRREDRKNLRRAARCLTYRRLTDAEQLAGDGHRLLYEFFGRSAYRWRRDRLRPSVFRRWAASLLAEPRVLVLGAFAGGRLCEVHTSFRVRDVLIFDVAFAGQEGRLCRSSDGVLDFLRERAAHTDARLISLGPAGGKGSLDGFKLRRGAQLLALPARLRLSPAAAGLLRLASPGVFSRLRGMDEEAALRYSVLCPRA